MDRTIIDALRKAYELSPENGTLRLLLAKTLLDDQPAAAFDLLSGLDDAALTGEQDRLTASRIYLAGGDFKRVLGVLNFNTWESLLLKARACLLSHDNEQGLDFYKKAVAMNPAAEDPELEKSLSADITEAQSHGDNVIGFKVIRGKESEKTEVQEKSKDLFESDNQPGIAFKDVGGLEDVKKIITRKIILPFQKPGIFEKLKKRAGGGVLLYGPPGCGKTLIARATAGECGAQFYNVAISDILDMWLGNSEKRIHQLFDQARRTAPSVLFFDELEGLAGKRQDRSGSAGAGVISQFLSEMDGFVQNNGNILILGATNVPWSVDAAFRRPGRFDRVLFVPPPDIEARKTIFAVHLKDRPLEKNIDIDSLARATTGFSGADIGHVVDTACDLAIEQSLESRREIPVGMAHLREALEEIKPTTLEWLTTARNYARYSNEGGQYDDVLEFLNRHGK